MVLLLKYASVLALPEPFRVSGLVAAGALSRWSMVYATVRYPPARSDGLGSAYKASAGPVELAWATTLAVLLTLPLGMSGFGLMAVAWGVTVMAARYTMSKIPGLTGDVYGAICECTEVGLLIALPLLARG